MQLNDFYGLLADLESRLGGKKLLGDPDALQGCPTQGLILLFEPGETRSDERLRVVHVGINRPKGGEKATLPGRRKQHLGAGNRQGNHRSSILRKHLDRAMENRNNTSTQSPGGDRMESAKMKGEAGEQPEGCVSDYVAEMKVLWLPVEDADDRKYLKRNIIGLLTGENRDQPSEKWLGRSSPNDKIKKYGLWNVQHVKGPVDSYLLKRLKKAIQDTPKLATP